MAVYSQAWFDAAFTKIADAPATITDADLQYLSEFASKDLVEQAAAARDRAVHPRAPTPTAPRAAGVTMATLNSFFKAYNTMLVETVGTQLKTRDATITALEACVAGQDVVIKHLELRILELEAQQAVSR